MDNSSNKLNESTQNEMHATDLVKKTVHINVSDIDENPLHIE